MSSSIFKLHAWEKEKGGNLGNRKTQIHKHFRDCFCTNVDLLRMVVVNRPTTSQNDIVQQCTRMLVETMC